MSPFFSVVSLSLKPLFLSRPPFPNLSLSRPPFPLICLKTCPTATSFLHPKFLELSQLSINPRHTELSPLFFGVFCRRLEGILLPWLIFFFFLLISSAFWFVPNFMHFVVICELMNGYDAQLYLLLIWCPAVFDFDKWVWCPVVFCEI